MDWPSCRSWSTLVSSLVYQDTADSWEQSSATSRVLCTAYWRGTVGRYHGDDQALPAHQSNC